MKGRMESPEKEEQEQLGAKQLPPAVLLGSGIFLLLTPAPASSKHVLLITHDSGKSADDIFIFLYFQIP